MSRLLQPGQVLQTDTTKQPCRVKEFIASGTQGEVYRAQVGRDIVALKWYLPSYISQDNSIRTRLEQAIKQGSPSDRFLWPTELVSGVSSNSFGYLMPFRESRFHSLEELRLGSLPTSFYALATAGFELARHYFLLHIKGFCYRDVSDRNVSFDPTTGEIRIGDNDNVDINGNKGTINGTPEFMAPEIVREVASPTAKTDVFSLSVLLFHILFKNHPLKGRKVYNIHIFDWPAHRHIFGEHPVFIFDPANRANEPVSSYEDEYRECGANAMKYWPIYPQFIRDLFTRTFTQGILDPRARVSELEWQDAMIRLRDSIVYCPKCKKGNFYDADTLKANGGRPGTCWNDGIVLTVPPRIRIGQSVIILNNRTRLFPHHLGGNEKKYDFSTPIAEVTENPNVRGQLGLRNLGVQKWTVSTGQGVADVLQNQSVGLSNDITIHFGSVDGTVRF